MPFPYLRQYHFPRALSIAGRIKLAFKEQAVVSTGFLLCVLSGIYGVYKTTTFSAAEQDVKRYKLKYTVYREGDPRISRIKE